MKKSKIKLSKGKSFEELPNKVAYAWTRVSSEGQKTRGSSLASQEEDIKAFAAQHGITIKKWYGQDAESGTKRERKLFDVMVADVRKDKQVNIILCFDSKRFGRTGGKTINLKDELQEEGIYVVYTSEANYNRNDVGGYYADSIRDIQGKVDVNYRKTICAEGTVRMLNRGEWCFRVPLGYTRVRREERGNVKHHVIEINDTGKILRNAWVWRAQGERVIDIVQRLNNLGVRLSNGKPINEKNLSKILHNIFYTGWFEHELIDTENHRIKGNYPALIDETTFNLANGISHHVGYEQVKETMPFPLKRHIYCDCCGGALTGYTRARKKHTHFYYKCNTHGCKCNCNANDMHTSYLDLLAGYTVKEELLPIIKKMLQEEINDYLGESKRTLTTLRSRETEKSNQLEEVEYKYAIGVIPQSAYEVAKKRLSTEVSEVVSEIREIENQLSNTFPSIDKMMLMCCKLSDLWEKSNFKGRQQLQNLVFPSGVRYSRLLGNYRTPEVNKVFSLIRTISENYDKEQSKSDSDCSSESPFVEKRRLERPTPTSRT